MRNLKEIMKLVMAILYAPFLSLLGKEPRRIVLYYHGLSKTNVVNFRKQMVYMADKCRVIKPSKIKSTVTDGAKILAAITFDDGFISVIENAVPILREYGLMAAICVPVGNLARPPIWNIPDCCSERSETIMSEQQIRELNIEGFEIFSHTFTHPVLTELDDNTLKAELIDSKLALEKIFGREVSGISYPYGTYDDRVCEFAKQAGYKLGFTIEPGIVDSSTDNMQIGRIAVSPRDSLFKFKLKVSGAYQVIKTLKAIKEKILNNKAKRLS